MMPHRSPLQAPYNGPFRVLEAGPKSVVVDMGRKYISVDRLKAAHVVPDEPVVLAQPPRRGRPPKSAPVPCPPSVAPLPVPVNDGGVLLP